MQHWQYGRLLKGKKKDLEDFFLKFSTNVGSPLIREDACSQQRTVYQPRRSQSRPQDDKQKEDEVAEAAEHHEADVGHRKG